MKASLLFFFLFNPSNSNAQDFGFKPYYYIELDSGDYESIVKVNVYSEDTLHLDQSGYRYLESGSVGYEVNESGYGFYTQTIDTFYVLYELQIVLDTMIRSDTLRQVNKGIVFINPYPDFYLSNRLRQDPFAIMYMDDCSKKNVDCRCAIGRMYTQAFDENGFRQGCILNDENGTLYHYLHTNRTLAAKGYFKNGLPHGTWYFYSDTGQLTREYVFD